MGMRGRQFFSIAIVLTTILLSPRFLRASTTESKDAAVVVINGTIDDFQESSFIKRFDRAKASGVKTVIVEIDTYGGLVPSALNISRYIKRQSEVHTIAFVKDKAISAGAMIAMA